MAQAYKIKKLFNLPSAFLTYTSTLVLPFSPKYPCSIMASISFYIPDTSYVRSTSWFVYTPKWLFISFNVLPENASEVHAGLSRYFVHIRSSCGKTCTIIGSSLSYTIVVSSLRIPSKSNMSYNTIHSSPFNLNSECGSCLVNHISTGYLRLTSLYNI